MSAFRDRCEHDDQPIKGRILLDEHVGTTITTPSPTVA